MKKYLSPIAVVESFFASDVITSSKMKVYSGVAQDIGNDADIVVFD